MDIKTKCIHANGKTIDNAGAISVPIFQSATFAHHGGVNTGYDYARIQNPTREHLEGVITQLENGFDTLAFSTGMAATALLMELFEPGDHIISSDDLYGGSFRLFDSISTKNGLRFTYLDTTDSSIITQNITAKTKAIFIETPSNPLMHVTDIAEVAKIAHQNGLLLVVDNTFLTPYFQRPLDLGADVVIHSGTKFLGGHNDTLAGFLVVKDNSLSERLRYLYKTLGSCLAPFDSWLMIRGIKTLAVRLERQQENALAIATWLKAQPKIEAVYYPGLKSHPQYDVSCTQASGFGGVLSFVVDKEETARTLLEKVTLITFAESLGGTETLITYPATQTHSEIPEDVRKARGINNRLLRLSVGLESADDLIEELKVILEGI